MINAVGANAAEARGGDRHISPGNGQVKPGLGRCRLLMFAQPVQAFHVTMQAPNIVRVLRRAAQRIIQPQVGAVNSFRLLQMTLFKQQRAQGVSRGLDPAPWFGI